MYVTADPISSMKNKQFYSNSKCIIYSLIIAKKLSLILRGLRAHECFGIDMVVTEMQNSKSSGFVMAMITITSKKDLNLRNEAYQINYFEI